MVCSAQLPLAGGSHQVQMALKQSVVFSAVLPTKKQVFHQPVPASPGGVPGVEPCAAPTGCLVTSLETHAR